MRGRAGLDWLFRLLARSRSLLRGVSRRSEVEADMREEFRHHIELRTQDLIRDGLPPKEAARRAHLEFGHVETHRERARIARGLGLVDQSRFSWLDIKLGVRMLLKYPALTLVALLALGVGIPIGLGPLHFFSAFKRPLPEDEDDRIRGIRYSNVATTGPFKRGASYYELTRWREELSSFSMLGAHRPELHSISAGGMAGPPVLGARVTASTFALLGVPPILGRTLTEQDEVIGAPDVVVIGHDLWRSRLGADAEIVGETIRLSGVPHVVVGVMPDGFLFPSNHQLWLPLRETSASRPETSDLWIFGRLADGVSEEEAHAEVSARGRQVAAAYPDVRGGLEAEVVPFGLTQLWIPRGSLATIPEFYWFQLGALFLLFVACANVAILMFARTATRFREVAVRTALGASRLRLLSQMFVESLVLAVLATGAGLLAADQLAGKALAAMVASDSRSTLPYWFDLGITREAVVLGLALAVLSAVIAGVIPALKVTGPRVHESLKRAGPGGSGIRFGGVTTALIVLDVAVAVYAVGLAGLLSKRLLEGVRENELVGVPADEYLAVELSLPTPERDGVVRPGALEASALTERLDLTQQALFERLEAEPAVRGVAAASHLPRMEHVLRAIDVEAEEPLEPRFARRALVDIGYFEGLDAPILSGRGFTIADLASAERPAVVNTAFVDGALGGRNPLGRRLRFPTSADEEPGWHDIVGVVGPLGMSILSPDGGEGVYLPAAPGELHPLRFAVHVGPDPEAFTPRLREIVSEVDPLATIDQPISLDSVKPSFEWGFEVLLNVALMVLVGVLLSLAASGLYAIMSFAVSERAREIGIRAALGAGRDVVALVVARRALWQIGLGALAGTPGVVWLFFEMRTYAGLELSDASTALAALLPGLGVLVLVALLACVAPTLRALRIDPNEVLKAEG